MNKTTSTNDYLKQLLTNFTPLPEYTAIMANIQTQGRGQRGTSWLSEPHQNLTVSLYLKPQELPISKQFFLTIIGSLAIHDSLKHYINHRISIKWPNDIYIDNRKIGGLLFENKISGHTLSGSVLGIGLNVRQTSFPTELQYKAVSLKQLAPHRSFSFIEIIQYIQRYLSHYKNLLTTGQYDTLLQLYNAYLFQKDELKTYRANNRIVEGKIIGVEADGLLQLWEEGEVTKYDLKDIVYQL
ncbi:MAG TPA: biotin--[acetyl-CoA-carboxylase] ligase [Sphingobacterium sp.]|nr:biotin--[acetyl-CoA-carboxylase] ligase [Sphingobacterium sp.]